MRMLTMAAAVTALFGLGIALRTTFAQARR